MRTFLAVAFLSGGVAHATLGPALRIADVAPDIPLIVVVMLALRRGPEFGCGAGFLAGLLQDAATGGLLGVQALTKSVIGFAIGGVGSRLRVSAPLVRCPASSCSRWWKASRASRCCSSSTSRPPSAS
jgi:rod shape-determining protein MreD